MKFKDYNEYNEYDVQHNDYEIIEHIKYPKYVSSGFKYDIGLLRLNRKVENVSPGCLAEQYEPNTDILTAIGWGHTTYEGTGSQTLLKVNLELYTQKECNNQYDSHEDDGIDEIDETQICVGPRNEDEKGTCQVGDLNTIDIAFLLRRYPGRIKHLIFFIH